MRHGSCEAQAARSFDTLEERGAGNSVAGSDGPSTCPLTTGLARTRPV